MLGQTFTLAGRTLTDTVTRSRSGRITGAITTDSSSTVDSSSWSYGYDTAGRLSTAVLATAGTRPQVALTYGYAATGGCGPDPAAGRNGSRTSMTRQTGTGPIVTSTWCTDGASRLTAATGETPLTAATIDYDSHGNALRLGTQSWTYDGAGRVATATANGITPVLVSYQRDSLGRVIVSGPADTPTRYGFTGTDDSPDLQLTDTGALRERYLGLPGGVLHTASITGGLTNWAITTLHGDTTATLTGTTVTTGYLYEPFGQPLTRTDTRTPDPTTATPTTRTGPTTDAWHGAAQRGYEHTNGLNQMLMGARTYLPAHGIFTATDPIEGGNTTTYTYPQDPINEEDLTGTTRCGTRLCSFLFGALPGGAPGTAAGRAAQAVIRAFSGYSARVMSSLIARMESRIGRAAKTGATAVEDVGAVLKNLPKGRSSGVRTVGSDQELGELYGKLSRGGTPVEVPGYKGSWVELPNGTRVGIRDASKSGGRTIDIKMPDGTKQKVHIDE